MVNAPTSSSITTTTTTSTEKTEIAENSFKKSTKLAGELAIADIGSTSLRVTDREIVRLLRELDPCGPRARWYKVDGKYLCGSGEHAFDATEIELARTRMLLPTCICVYTLFSTLENLILHPPPIDFDQPMYRVHRMNLVAANALFCAPGHCGDLGGRYFYCQGK